MLHAPQAYTIHKIYEKNPNRLHWKQLARILNKYNPGVKSDQFVENIESYSKVYIAYEDRSMNMQFVIGLQILKQFN